MASFRRGVNIAVEVEGPISNRRPVRIRRFRIRQFGSGGFGSGSSDQRPTCQKDKPQLQKPHANPGGGPGNRPAGGLGNRPRMYHGTGEFNFVVWAKCFPLRKSDSALELLQSVPPRRGDRGVRSIPRNCRSQYKPHGLP